MAVPPPPPAEAIFSAKPLFSVEDFLKLATDLPLRENAHLIIRVMEATLASMEIRMADILPEIARREAVVQARIEGTQKRVEDLENELHARRSELKELESELHDTLELRGLLTHTRQMADSSPRRDTSSTAETLVLAKAGVKK
jgi:hypothetical protein